MAKYKNSTFGTITGSVGDDTATTWKGEKVLKKKASPANPNTASQKSQRDKFFLCNTVGQQINSTVLQPYWNYLFNKMSGFNAFIKENIKRVSDGSVASMEDLLVSKGSYQQVASIGSATYDDTTGDVVVSWVDTPGARGSADDQMIVVVLDATDYDIATRTGIWVSAVDSSKVRSDASATLSLPTGRTATDLHAYVGVANPADAGSLDTANSKYSAVTAA
jgi:hypothetical protein